MSYGAIRSSSRRSASDSERAAPYSSAASSGPLAARVKKVQSASWEDAKAWRDYCDAEGGGFYDPSKHDDGFLRKFLARTEGDAKRSGGQFSPRSIGAAGPVGGGGAGSLTEQVKEMQRSSSEMTEDWRQFCDAECGGMYDPSRHDASTLKRWMARWSRGGGGPSWETSNVGGGEGPLTQQVKDLQRTSKDMADVWRSFCDAEGGGKYDPQAHDAALLKRFLRSVGVEVSPQPASSGGGGLTEQVKELQRSSKQLTDDWRMFCDQEGGGIYDPAKHEGRTLKKWLSKVDWGPSWETSGSGGGGSLTEQVKELQRCSNEATEAWRSYCDSQGTGKYDPSLYDARFLKEFLSAMDGSPQRVSGGGGSLTEQVKDLQRGSMAATEDWRRFCDDECGGIYDPSKHEARSLKKWLGRFDGMGSAASTRIESAEKSWGGSWENGSGAGGGGSLTQQVKDVQRSSKEATDAWRNYCETQGNGKFDPQAYDAAFLKQFLSTMRSSPRQDYGGGRSWSGSGGSLTEQVKELQRSSKDNVDDWRQFCDDEGGGVYDPSKHEASFLKDWMARVGGSSSRRAPTGSQHSLIQEVKDLQRSSKDIADDWREFCDKEGEGRYDPSAHDAAFLERWISKHSMRD